MRTFISVIALGLAYAASCAAAEQAEVGNAVVGPLGTEPVKAWSGEAGLGIVSTTGNTVTRTINIKAKVVNDRPRWRHTGALDILGSSDHGIETARRYLAAEKSDLKLTDVSHLFGAVTFEADRFSGYLYRVSEAVGYGRALVTKERLQIGAEAGIGLRQSVLRETRRESVEGIVRLAGALQWLLSANAKLSEEINSELGAQTTITRSLFSLTTVIVGNLSAKFNFNVERTSNVPQSIARTDTETSTTLVYTF